MRPALLALIALVLACTDNSATSESATDASTTRASSPTTTGGPPTNSTTEPTTTTGDPPEPVCCGCLCLDPGWSCAANTCLLSDGTAAALGPEAGFLAIPPHQYSYFDGPEEFIADVPEARLWYVFQPADEAPETRPLLVFFNGGPGYSTAILFGLNTGRMTADPDVAGRAIVAENPHSWTRFANLLHVDPHETGFSYDIAPPSDKFRPRPSASPEHDSAYLNQFILKFLERHPQLEKNPVVLVGESYGGLRAFMMSQQFVYPDELVGSNYYRNQQLYDALRAHLGRTIPDLPEGPIGPDVATAQFGTNVHIQPLIANIPEEIRTSMEDRKLQFQCVADPDQHQCDHPAEWSYTYSDAAIMALLDPTTLSALTGVDPTTIAWLYADARVGAFTRGVGSYDTSALTAIFGDFGPNDDIYHAAYGVGGSLHGHGNFGNKYYAYIFLRTLPFVRTFITNAGKDIHMFGPDVPNLLAFFGAVVASADHVTSGPEARPGQIVVQYQPKLGLPDNEHTIRFPFYSAAGHMVTHLASGDLLEDIEAWFYEK